MRILILSLILSLPCALCAQGDQGKKSQDPKPGKRNTVQDLPKPVGQKPGPGKVLGLPSPARDKADRSRSLVIGRRRPQGTRNAGQTTSSSTTTPPKDGDLAMASFIEALGSKKKKFADAELVAEYSLLTEGERKSLIARAHRLSNLAVTRLARVWRALPERSAAPALVTILKSRKLGKDTGAIVDVLFFLLGPDARLVAIDSLTSSYKTLRSVVIQRIPGLLTKDDLPRLRSLLDHKDQGVRVAALQGLGRWLAEHPNEELSTLASNLRHRDGAVRAQTAALLAERGAAAVDSLLPLVKNEADGQAWFLAALLLARRELVQEAPLLPDTTLRRLGRARYDARVLSRTSASIVAGIRLFDDPASLRVKTSGFADLSPAEIIDGLIEVTDVSTYYPELGVCHDTALLVLRLLTGEDFAADHRRWSNWWRKSKSRFVPYSRDLELDATSLAQARLLMLEDDKLRYVLLGRDAIEPDLRDGGLRIRLEHEQFSALVDKLRVRGLFDLEQRMLESRGIVEGRALELRTSGGRARDGFPRSKSLRLATFDRVLSKTLEDESWQRFCPTELQDKARRDWWIEQRRQFAKAATPAAKRGHAVALALRVLPKLGASARTDAIDLLLAESRLEDSQLDGDDGTTILKFAGLDEVSDDDRLKVFEVLARTKAVETSQMLDALAKRLGPTLRSNLVQILAVRGESAILTALAHESPSIRATAASESARIESPAVTAALIAGLRDADWDVRRRAVESLGKQECVEAKAEVFRLAADSEPLVRHASLLALGRIGGKGAFERLVKATGPGQAGDRLAAVRALAILDEPRAASTLVGIAAAHLSQPLGLQALKGLESRSTASLRAEVRRWLESSDDPVLRQRFTFLLGDMGDPAVAASLLSLVERGVSGVRACLILAQLSGIDHCARPDRVARYRKWIEDFGGESLSVRLLHALSEAKVEHGLVQAMEKANNTVGIVDELSRLVVETKDANWPLRSLAAQMLRDLTGQDYGAVRRNTRLGVRRGLVERYRQFVLSKRGR